MKSISRIIEKLSLEAPEAPAATCRNKSISRYDSAHNTSQLAHAYIDIGVGQGDPVTIALPNPITFYQVCNAVWKNGAMGGGVSSKLSAFSKLSKAELQAIIELAQSTLLDRLATRLIRYKIPRTIDFVNKPVRCDAGKVRRTELNAGAAV